MCFVEKILNTVRTHDAAGRSLDGCISFCLFWLVEPLLEFTFLMFVSGCLLFFLMHSKFIQCIKLSSFPQVIKKCHVHNFILNFQIYTNLLTLRYGLVYYSEMFWCLYIFLMAICSPRWVYNYCVEFSQEEKVIIFTGCTCNL